MTPPTASTRSVHAGEPEVPVAARRRAAPVPSPAAPVVGARRARRRRPARDVEARPARARVLGDVLQQLRARARGRGSSWAPTASPRTATSTSGKPPARAFCAATARSAAVQAERLELVRVQVRDLVAQARRPSTAALAATLGAPDAPDPRRTTRPDEARPLIRAGARSAARSAGSKRSSSGSPFSANGTSIASKSRGTTVRSKTARASSRISRAARSGSRGGSGRAAGRRPRARSRRPGARCCGRSRTRARAPPR